MGAPPCRRLGQGLLEGLGRGDLGVRAMRPRHVQEMRRDALRCPGASFQGGLAVSLVALTTTGLRAHKCCVWPGRAETRSP